MVPDFEILLDCHNNAPELKKGDTTWVPTDWADHMDPDAMTTLLGDHIYNIEEEEYWEACQHMLKNPYELKANDENEEGGTTLSDDEDISKVIANRLKPLINSIISETQSAFTTNKLITNNVLIAFESLQHMKTSCFEEKSFMAQSLI